MQEEILMAAGYWKEGQWTSLGLLPEDGILVKNGSHANAITADGNTIAGQLHSSIRFGFKAEPVLWQEGIYSKRLETQDRGGGSILRMSDDGKVFGGWVAPAYTHQPVVWTEQGKELLTLDGKEINGEVTNISANGKYASLSMSSQSAVYDIEEKTFIYPGKHSGTSFSFCAGVSNDGFIIGYSQMGILSPKKYGFVYSEQMEFLDFEEFVRTNLKDIIIPSNFTFNAPRDISADGKTIVGDGFMNGQLYPWVIKIDNNFVQCNKPSKLTYSLSDLTSLNMKWEKPKTSSDSAVSLIGYNIYKNGTKINDTPIESESFAEQDLVFGIHSYSVSALWSNGCESSLLDPIVVAVADNYDLPFFEDFSSASYTDNFWQGSPSENWGISNIHGQDAPCAEFRSSLITNYSHSLVSKKLDATSFSELQLTYDIYFEHFSKTTLEQMGVEIFDGVEWIEVKTYTNQGGDFNWKNEVIDISQFAGKMINLRFRAHGENCYNIVYWAIDNIRVFNPSTKPSIYAPASLFTLLSEDKKVIDLRWTNPDGSIPLTYCEAPLGSVSNEGVTFIAINQFTPSDLVPFQGAVMEKVSFHSHRQGNGKAAEFKLLVYEDGVKKYEQEVFDVNTMAWNDVVLTSPFTIDASKTLQFGFEIKHAADDAPLARDTSDLGFDKGNLFSEDNGVIWQSLYQHGLRGNWAITGHLTLPDSEMQENSLDLLGYNVFRNGIKINEKLVKSQFYFDKKIQGNNHCYTVNAVFEQTWQSEQSEPSCINFTSTDKVRNGVTAIGIFPNPVKAGGSIKIIGVEENGLFNVRVFDSRGTLLIEQSLSSENNTLKMPDAKGMYVIRIKTAQETISKKVTCN